MRFNEPHCKCARRIIGPFVIAQDKCRHLSWEGGDTCARLDATRRTARISQRVRQMQGIESSVRALRDLIAIHAITSARASLMISFN
jgi:hypothetical protein